MILYPLKVVLYDIKAHEAIDIIVVTQKHKRIFNNVIRLISKTEFIAWSNLLQAKEALA